MEGSVSIQLTYSLEDHFQEIEEKRLARVYQSLGRNVERSLRRGLGDQLISFSSEGASSIAIVGEGGVSEVEAIVDDLFRDRVIVTKVGALEKPYAPGEDYTGNDKEGMEG